MTSVLRNLPLWMLVATSACTAQSNPTTTAEPVQACVDEDVESPPEPKPVEPIEPLEPELRFEPTDHPGENPTTVVSKGGRGCHVPAVLNPEVLVVYSMIDIYALIAKQLHTVLIDDEERIPLNGRALGFVVPTGCS